MVRISGTWDDDQLETFLRESKIPIRLSSHRPDASLWLVALWYRYRDGSFECATWEDAKIVQYLRNDSEVAFDVSTNESPYRGVRGNGTATMSPDTDKEVLRGLIERYGVERESPLAEWLLDDAREGIRIRVQPRVMYSWDYSDSMV